MSRFQRQNFFRWTSMAGGTLLRSMVKREWGQRFLFDHLNQIPGVPAKVSQWLEQKWNLTLEDSVPIIPHAQVLELLATEVPSLSPKIKKLSTQAKGASLGQVHRVELLDGRVLAIKIQYPGLAEEITQQIDSLIWLMVQSPASKYGLDIALWRRDLGQMFGDELDYLGESVRQQEWIKELGPGSSALVPLVFPEWCTERVLVQEYLEGKELAELLLEPLSVRKKVAQSLAQVLIRSLLSQSQIHGDLQPKNWAWCSKLNKLILYDFGSCIEWGPQRQRLFEALVVSMKSPNHVSLLGCLVELGFDRSKLEIIESELPALISLLLEPFWNPNLGALSRWQGQELTQEILGEKGWYFRTAGPPWFLWLMRSLVRVFHALSLLDDSVDVAAIFDQEQAKLSPRRWDQVSIPQSSKPWIDSGKPSLSASQGERASYLNIRVTEGNQETVALRFPAHVLRSIEDLMGPDLLARIREDKIDLSSLKRRALVSGYLKQELFIIKKDNKTVSVWLD